MKLMVAGSRSIDKNILNISAFMPDDVELLITGGTDGVDTMAEQYAAENDIKVQTMHPKYEHYGNGAPTVRNKQMVDMADRVLVFWDGKSRGAKFIYDYAKEVGTPVDMMIMKM